MINTICINGVTIETNGGCISVYNNKIYIDNKEITDVNFNKEIIIKGDCNRIECDCNVTVEGNVYGDIKCAGSCKCGHVSGNVSAGGSVHSENVTGASINAGGSVHVKRG